MSLSRASEPPNRPTHPRRQTFVLLAAVFAVVLVLAVISTVTEA